jgi:predicted esterase
MNRSSLTLLIAASVFLGSALGAAGCGGGGGGGSSRAAAGVAPTSSTPTTGLPPSSAPTGSFERTYAGRVYQLHVPASHDGTRALPLVLAFHGSGDTAKNFFETLRVAGWLNAAEQAGVILVVPATKSPYQTFPVWSGNPNNDLPQMQTELADVLALLDQDVAATWRVDPARVHGLGFSDGGLFLGAVGLASPRLATCTILGYGWGGFDITPIATRRPVHLACGTADQFFNAAQQTQAFVAAQGHDTLWEPIANVGHTVIGLSAAIDPAAALGWLLARPPGAGAPAPGPTPGTPPPGVGSGGAGGATGLSTRTVTTQAQGGVPALTVSYDVFVPSGYAPATPIPVVFAANMGLQPWQALAQAETFIVVDLRDHDRNGGWRFDTDVLVLDAVLQDVDAAWNVNTKRRYFHGFSAGAHWGYAVVLANANLFAGLGVSAGSMATAIQQGVWPNGVARKLPVAIRHGTNDTVVPVAAGRADRDRLMLAAHPVELTEFAGGHTVSAQDAQAIWAFLRQHSAP